MEEYKTLDKETVLAELRFAIEHKIKFSKKDLKEILSFGDIQDICNELNINAKMHTGCSCYQCRKGERQESS